MTWTNPKTWITSENLTSIKYNEQIQQNIQYLLDKLIRTVEVRNGVSDLTAPVASGWTPVDNLVFYNNILTTGGDVEVRLNINVRNAGTGGITKLDVLVIPKNKASFFLSSLTNTPLADGLFLDTLGTNYFRRRSYNFLWQGVPKDEYQFQLWWNASVGDNLLNYTNTVNQFTIEERGYG